MSVTDEAGNGAPGPCYAADADIDGREACNHLDWIPYLDPSEEIAGCEKCLAIGQDWEHLRMCHTCGHIGCCDNSPGQHATVHHHETGHPLIRSAEPGEDWSWCYVDELALELRRR